MAYTVERTEAFEDDLDKALNYLLDGQAPRAALSLLNSVEAAIGLLELNPHLHAISRKEALRGRGFWEYLVKNYVIVYGVKGKDVILLRLFHQTQLYERFVVEWK